MRRGWPACKHRDAHPPLRPKKQINAKRFLQSFAFTCRPAPCSLPCLRLPKSSRSGPTFYGHGRKGDGRARTPFSAVVCPVTGRTQNFQPSTNTAADETPHPADSFHRAASTSRRHTPCHRRTGDSPCGPVCSPHQPNAYSAGADSPPPRKRKCGPLAALGENRGAAPSPVVARDHASSPRGAWVPIRFVPCIIAWNSRETGPTATAAAEWAA